MLKKMLSSSRGMRQRSCSHKINFRLVSQSVTSSTITIENAKPFNHSRAYSTSYLPLTSLYKITNHYSINRTKGRSYCSSSASLSLPPHIIMPMPALSPTMEEGTIGKWNINVGDKFEAGSSICDVETDKASVSLDATDEGYLAKILVDDGATIKVGTPLLVTVEEEGDVKAFADFTASSTATAASPTPSPTPTTTTSPSTPSSITTAHTSASIQPAKNTDGRIIASPLAKKLAREAGLDLSTILITGTGPGGRIVAADVLVAAANPTAKTASGAPASYALPTGAGAVTKGDIYSDFHLSELSKTIASTLSVAKQEVPHYYLSVDLDLTKVLQLRADLNSDSLKASEDTGLSLVDFMVKAAAVAMKQVPDANASWMTTFVRQYDQVDINVVMGAGNSTAAPVIRDVGATGLQSISSQIAEFEEGLFVEEEGSTSAAIGQALQIGTFSIHNLGMYGVKAAAPVIMTPQACALSLGSVVDTVVPDGKDWKVAPIMTATLSCDHRVIDGAVGATWLQSFKNVVENPVAMLI